MPFSRQKKKKKRCCAPTFMCAAIPNNIAANVCCKWRQVCRQRELLCLCDMKAPAFPVVFSKAHALLHSHGLLVAADEHKHLFEYWTIRVKKFKWCQVQSWTKKNNKYRGVPSRRRLWGYPPLHSLYTVLHKRMSYCCFSVTNSLPLIKHDTVLQYAQFCCYREATMHGGIRQVCCRVFHGAHRSPHTCTAYPLALVELVYIHDLFVSLYLIHLLVALPSSQLHSVSCIRCNAVETVQEVWVRKMCKSAYLALGFRRRKCGLCDWLRLRATETNHRGHDTKTKRR